jgi:hypothetical protein
MFSLRAHAIDASCGHPLLTAQRGGTAPVACAASTIVFDRGRGAVTTTSGRLLDATSDVSNAGRLPESDGGSCCVQPANRTGNVMIETMKMPVSSFARRMTHYLLAPHALYEWRCGAKFCGNTIVHTTLTFRWHHSRNRRAYSNRNGDITGSVTARIVATAPLQYYCSTSMVSILMRPMICPSPAMKLTALAR